MYFIAYPRAEKESRKYSNGLDFHIPDVTYEALL